MVLRKIEDDTPYKERFDKNGNKLGGVFRKNEPNAPSRRTNI